MKLTVFVTFLHSLILAFFYFQKTNPVKPCPSKIIVNIKEEKMVSKTNGVTQPLPKQVKKSQHIEAIEDAETLASITLEPLPAIAPLQHEMLTIQDIPPPPSKPKAAPKLPSKKLTAPNKSPTAAKSSAKTSSPKKDIKPKASSPPISKNSQKKSSSPAPKKTDQQLLSMMKDGLNKLDKMPASIKGAGTSYSSAPKIAKLMSESLEMTPTELSYAEEIAMYLKHHLHFPDEGSMKIQLILSHLGKVESFSILSSSSSKNKEIGEKAIATIAFPAFGSRFQEKSKSFTLQIRID